MRSNAGASIQQAQNCFICNTPGIGSKAGVAHLISYKCPKCKSTWTTLDIERILTAKKRRAEARKRLEKRENRKAVG